VRLIGLSGWSGSGKTTLIKALIPALNARGRSVSTVKHAHHAFDIDKPGKDSYVHRQSGAREVLISSSQRWALMSELRGAPEPRLGELLGRLGEVDLVLIEGFKREAHPKIEIHRAAVGKPLLYPDDPQMVAIASDPELPDAPIPHVSLNDVDAIADLVERHAVSPETVRWGALRG
jgi:molybdopterin-guanine dinucleotide biosynthesis protein B